MDTNTAAPVPFSLGAQVDEEKAQIIAADGEHVAYVERDDVRAVAAQIIRAVNSHEALVSAVSRALEYADADEGAAARSFRAAMTAALKEGGGS